MAFKPVHRGSAEPLSAMPIDDIRLEPVKGVIAPLWRFKPATATAGSDPLPWPEPQRRGSLALGLDRRGWANKLAGEFLASRGGIPYPGFLGGGKTMFKRVLTGLFSSGFFFVAAAPAFAAGITDQIGNGFRDGVSDCLEAGLRGVQISQLPADLRKGVAPVADDQRATAQTFFPTPNPVGPLWEVLTAKGYVLLSEPSPAVCEVFAYGPPVDPTFKAVIADARKRASDVVEAPVTPGYDPIVYRLDLTRKTGKLVLQLHGAEPGTPNHLVRFSLLRAELTRLPATP